MTPDLRAEQKTRLSFVCGPEWTFIRAAFRLREDQANKVFLPLPDCVIPLTFLCALKCEDLVCVRADNRVICGGEPEGQIPVGFESGRGGRFNKNWWSFRNLESASNEGC